MRYGNANMGALIAGTITLVTIFLVVTNPDAITTVIRAVGTFYTGAVGALQGPKHAA